jgi:AhpD family alkylhydroperoxidase
MKARMDINKAEPGIYEAMFAADKVVKGFDIEPKLKELIKVRVSQINGCGYCINYHTKDALALGETNQRLFALSAWWETPFFSDEERAALKLAEEVTRISHGVSDETYQRAVNQFGEQKVAQLIFIAITINSWNRVAIPVHMVAEQD